MASGFDEWVTARTPSLLRFARVLGGSDAAAETAVRTALARVWSSWATAVRSEDPDLLARRLVVRACPARQPVTARERSRVPLGAGPADVPVDPQGGVVAAWLAGLPLRRRAVVVLDLLEGRPDSEIADLLDVSEASVRSQRERALAALPDVVPGSAAARRGAVRAALEETADAAPGRLPDLPAPVEPPRARPHRSAWLSAFAVLGLVVGVAWTSHESRSSAGVITYPRVSVPASWRFESYDGVQVRVPSTWGWGGAPIRADYFPGNGLGGCGSDSAAVGPDGSGSSGGSTAAFVGRPAVLTFRCVPWGSDGVLPSTDAVWFGSPLRIGLKGLGTVVAETRAVGGQHVTVFSADTSLRREILGSAEVVDTDGNGCPTREVQQPVAGPVGLQPSGLSVCVYSQDTGVPVLLWSGRADAAAARRYAAAVGRSAATGSARACTDTPHGQWVALGLTGGGGERWDVVNLRCGQIVTAHGPSPTLRPDLLAPWAHHAIQAYVSGPPGAAADVASYFRGGTG